MVWDCPIFTTMPWSTPWAHKAIWACETTCMEIQLLQLESCTKKHFGDSRKPMCFSLWFCFAKTKKHQTFYCCLFSSGWLSHPSEKKCDRQIADHLLKDRGKNHKFLSCHHLVFQLEVSFRNTDRRSACTAPGRLFPSWQRMLRSQVGPVSWLRCAVTMKGSPIKIGKSWARRMGVKTAEVNCNDTPRCFTGSTVHKSSW